MILGIGKIGKSFRTMLKRFHLPVHPARDKSVSTRMFVDSNHPGDKEDRRSRTGFVIYLDTTFIQW